MMGQRELGEPKDRNELAVIVIDSEKWNRRWSISSRKIPDPYGCGGLPPVPPSPPHNSLWIMDEARARQSSYNSCHQRGWRSAEIEQQQHEQQEATTSKPYSFVLRIGQDNTHKNKGPVARAPQWIGIFCSALVCVFVARLAAPRRAQQQSSIQSSIYNSHSAYRFEVIWASGERNSIELVGGGKTQSTKKLRPIFQPFFALDPFLFFISNRLKSMELLHHR